MTSASYLVDGTEAGKMPWSARKVLGAGALALGAWTLGATIWAVDHVEHTLVDETAAALTAEGVDLTSVNIDFDYRDGTVRGLDAQLTEAEAQAAVDTNLLRDLELVSDQETPAAEPTLTPAPTAEPEPTAEPTAEPTTVPPGTAATEVVITRTADRQLVLTGTVLTEAHRDQLVAAASAAVGADNVDDQLAVADLPEAVAGADDRIDALAATIAPLTLTEQGTSTLTDADLVIDATSFDLAAIAVLADLDAADAAVPTTSSVVMTRPPVLGVDEQVVLLQAEIDSLAAEIQENVVFETDSAELTQLAASSLDKVVEAMRRYPLPVVDISGHTDSEGPGDYNLALSDQRAGAVLNYLNSQGVDIARLSSRGAGPNEPVASNDTEEGRAQNRRVQFEALAAFN